MKATFFPSCMVSVDLTLEILAISIKSCGIMNV